MTFPVNSSKNDYEECYLFDPQILHDLEFENQKSASYKPEINLTNLGEGLTIRPLCISDYDKGYLSLLNQLTEVGDVSREQFEERFQLMKSQPNLYYTVVIEDTVMHRVVGTTTLVKEMHFIRQCGFRGRIEDVIVHSSYQGKQLGKLLVDALTLLSKRLGCYMVSLECDDRVVPFYSKFGYVKEEEHNYMLRRFIPK
ncbi:glucosamine 6-phosphate N-acetyltransferase-like isoform X2 [Saccostrea echinata]|uniref:glucosamine 6-phosphate N-acetyltransferase-like isoform X2 n=1 Tax=Saccostrea echinata TaxID=191078 RepID=UPI002A811AF4|nr:glucosamine 6-phosphate N-acetyltransferase-like isoform X2 [Saccostrea echinata]